MIKALETDKLNLQQKLDEMKLALDNMTERARLLESERERMKGEMLEAERAHKIDLARQLSEQFSQLTKEW